MEIYWLLDFWLHQPYRMSCITCIPTCMVVEKWWNRRFSLGPYALNSLIGTWSASKKDHINIWSYILTQLSISYPTFNFFSIGKICSRKDKPLKFLNRLHVSQLSFSWIKLNWYAPKYTRMRWISEILYRSRTLK